MAQPARMVTSTANGASQVWNEPVGAPRWPGDFEQPSARVADLERLDADVTVGVDGSVSGSAVWSGRWLQGGTEPLVLAAEGLEIGLLQMNGASTDYELQEGKLRIYPNHAPRRGLTFTVRVVYRSRSIFGFHSVPVPSAGQSVGAEQSGSGSTPGVTPLLDEPPIRFSSFLPRGVRHWLPSPDTPAEQVVGAIEVLHDNGETAIATGEPVPPVPATPASLSGFGLPGAATASVGADSPDRLISRFEWEAPVPVSELFLAVGPFQSITFRPPSTPITQAAPGAPPAIPDSMAAPLADSTRQPAPGIPQQPAAVETHPAGIRLHLSRALQQSLPPDSLMRLMEFTHRALQAAERIAGSKPALASLDLLLLDDAVWEQDLSAAGVVALRAAAAPTQGEGPSGGWIDFGMLREQAALGVAAQHAGVGLSAWQWGQSGAIRLLQTWLASTILLELTGMPPSRPSPLQEDTYPLIRIETVPPNIYETHSLTLLRSLTWQWSFLLESSADDPLPAATVAPFAEIAAALLGAPAQPGAPRGSHSHVYFAEWALLAHGIELLPDPQDQLSELLESAGIGWDRMLDRDGPAPEGEGRPGGGVGAAFPADEALLYEVAYTMDEFAGRLVLDFRSVGPPPDELVSVRIRPLPEQESGPARIETLSGASERIEIEYAFWTETVVIEAVDRNGERIENVRFKERKPFEMWIGQLRYAPSERDRAAAAAELSQFTENPDVQLVIQEALLRETSPRVRAELLVQLSNVTHGAMGTEEFFVNAYYRALEEVEEGRDALSELIESVRAMGDYPGNPRIPFILESVVRDPELPLELRTVALRSLHSVLPRETFLTELESHGIIDSFVAGTGQRVRLIQTLFEAGETETALFLCAELLDPTSQTPARHMLRTLELLGEHDADAERWAQRLRALMQRPDPRIRYAAVVLTGERLSEQAVVDLAQDVLPEEYDTRVRSALEQLLP